MPEDKSLKKSQYLKARISFVYHPAFIQPPYSRSLSNCYALAAIRQRAVNYRYSEIIRFCLKNRLRRIEVSVDQVRKPYGEKGDEFIRQLYLRGISSPSQVIKPKTRTVLCDVCYVWIPNEFKQGTEKIIW